MKEEEIVFSRAHLPPGFGKCDPDPVRLMLPTEVKEKLAGMAVLHGVTVSEYLREMVLKHLYGELTVIRYRMHGKQDTD